MMEGKTYNQAAQLRDPLVADIHYWFNPSSGYGSSMMPGIIIIILQQTLLIGIGMIGGTSKEKKQDSFLVPVALKKGGVLAMLFGKSLCLLYHLRGKLHIYQCSGFTRGLIIPTWAVYFTVLMLTIPFILAVIFMGITCSVLFKRRESSIMFMVFLSPIVIFLSGISWPSQSIPPFLYSLAHLFPSTIVMPAYLRVRSMGVGLYEIRHEYFQLLIQMGAYFCTAAIAPYMFRPATMQGKH